MTMYAVPSLMGGSRYVCGICVVTYNAGRIVRVPNNAWTICSVCNKGETK